MTKTTDKRQITSMVKQILASNSIDNLKLEIDLISAFEFYVVGRRAGRNIAELRQEIVESVERGTRAANERDAMEERIRRALGVNPATTPALWDAVIPFLIKADKKNETIERFARECEADPYGMPKTHQIANKPTLIMAVWPKVFREAVEPARADSDGGYR